MQRDIDHLAAAFFGHPTRENRKALVVGCAPLVHAIIGKLRIPDRLLATFEDLQGVGLLGLLEAIDRYDSTHGTRFTTYAYVRIRGAVVDYLRMIDVLPRERREELARAQKAVDTLGQQLGDQPGDQEVADFLGISLSDYHTLLHDGYFRHAASLHQQSEDEGTGPLVEVIPHGDGISWINRMDWNSDSEYVASMVRRLPERDQKILGYYFEDDLTLREIGEKLGLSEARISQIVSNLLRDLRSRLSRADRVAA